MDMECHIEPECVILIIGFKVMDFRMCSRIDLETSFKNRGVAYLKPLHEATTSTTHYLLYTSSKQRNKKPQNNLVPCLLRQRVMVLE